MSDHDHIESWLRSWGTQARADAAAVSLPEFPTRARRPRAALLVVAAATVVALAVTAVVIAATRPGSPAARRAIVLPTTSASHPAVPSSKAVTYHGLTIRVPAAWPLNAIRCGTPIEDTVVVTSVILTCLVMRPPHVTSVSFVRPAIPSSLKSAVTSRLRVGGYAATRVSGQRDGQYVIDISVPRLAAGLEISSPSRSLADSLAATLTFDAVDSNGCAVRGPLSESLASGRQPSRPGADRLMVPGTPNLIATCLYVGGWLEQGHTLDASQRSTITAVLNSLPTGFSKAPPDTYAPSVCLANRTPGQGPDELNDAAYVIHVKYATGPGVTVMARLGTCGELGATNGSRTGQRLMSLAETLTQIAGGTGYPETVLKR